MSSVLLAAAAAAVSPLPKVTADEALANAKALFSATPPQRQRCPASTSGEIVVCRELEDPAKQYVPSDTDSGVPKEDVPRVPPQSMLPPCINGGLQFCAPHLGATPRQLLIIDLKAIPEPPPGSDADRMAKGEIPTP